MKITATGLDLAKELFQIYIVGDNESKSFAGFIEK